MTSGYRMAESECAREFPELPKSADTPPNWPFLTIEPAMNREAGMRASHDELKRLLEAGSLQALKVFRLLFPLKVVGWALVITAFGAFLLASMRWSSWPLLTLGDIGLYTATLLAGFLIGKALTKLLGKATINLVLFRETVFKMLWAVGLAIFGWIVAWAHLWVFDRLFLCLGRIGRFTLAPISQSKLYWGLFLCLLRRS